MESFCWRNSRKTSNESAAITEALCQMCHTKWEKKVKEALRTRLNGNKRTETFVRLKKVAKWKTNLNLGTSACYKPTLKKRAIFFPCKRNFLSSKSVASRVYTAFPQITQKILITDTCHCLVPITVIPGFWKYSLLKKQTIGTILFSQSPRFRFSSPILDGLSVFFNAHHFFSSCENSSCV